MDVPAGSEEAFDLEKFKRDAEAEMQRCLDDIGRDTPEGKAMMLRWEAAKAPIPTPTKGEAEETQLIDLRLLVPSPLHRRTAPEPEEQTSVERSIEANGLRDPIEVRPFGEKFEIIRGHRRAEAYQQLRDKATTAAERAKYAAIPAKVRAGASDLDVVRWGIAEDLVRAEFPPADTARSLDLLRHLDPKLGTPQDLSDATGLHPKRVARYLQLTNAPAVVAEAVRVGLMVEVKAEGDEGAHKAQCRLDLYPALELIRLHAALSRKEGAGKGEGNETTSSDGQVSDDEQVSEADRKTRQAIERALTEKWGLREVKRYVDQAIAKLEGRKKVGRPQAPFKWNKSRGQLQVQLKRLDELDASQKAELRKVVEQILSRL